MPKPKRPSPAHFAGPYAECPACVLLCADGTSCEHLHDQAIAKQRLAYAKRAKGYPTPHKAEPLLGKWLADARSFDVLLSNSDAPPKVGTPGIKNDIGKLRYSLLPWSALREVVAVLEAGSRKYSDDNWKIVPDAPRRYLDAALRHLIAYASGEKQDPETGRSHLAHCAACCLFMIYFDITPTKE